jgi:outer membrane protein OmpA-like peptidoglycan-associated protein
MRRLLLLICFFIGINYYSFSQSTANLDIYFDINQYELNLESKKAIKNFIAGKRFNKIEILGYSDFLGSAEHNMRLSDRRAQNVRKYMVLQDVANDIVLTCKGMGIHPNSSYENRLNQDDRGIRQHRKVSIIANFETNIVETVNTDSINKDSEEPLVIPIFKEIDIEEYEAGSTIVFQNILFHGGSHRVKQESMPAMYQLLGLMQDNPKLKIQIDGHICCHDGPGDGYDIDAKDYNLSTNRAKAVYDFLIKNEISEDRMSYFGYSSMYRLYPEERTWREEDLNRRVEIVIVEK